VAGGGVLAACGGGREQDNSQLLEYLKSELGITPTTTRMDIARLAYEKAINPSWFINKRIGTYNNIEGYPLEFSTDAIGELSVPIQYPIDIKYPSPNPSETKVYAFKQNGVENQLIVYGTSGTVARSKAYGEDIIGNFLSQYFSGSKSPINKIHLDFNSVFFGPAFSAASPWMFDKQTGVVTYPAQEVLIRINRAHDFAANLGMSLDSILRFGFTNEVVGFLGNQFPETGDELIRGNVNESYSTLAAITSAIDKSFTELTLGGNAYVDLFPSIAKEMEILAEIGRK